MPCHCGCNQPALRNFLPGHDQKLRASLERRVGGLLRLEQLVDLTERFSSQQLDAVELKEALAELFATAHTLNSRPPRAKGPAHT